MIGISVPVTYWPTDVFVCFKKAAIHIFMKVMFVYNFLQQLVIIAISQWAINWKNSIINILWNKGSFINHVAPSPLSRLTWTFQQPPAKNYVDFPMTPPSNFFFCLYTKSGNKNLTSPPLSIKILLEKKIKYVAIKICKISIRQRIFR